MTGGNINPLPGLSITTPQYYHPEIAKLLSGSCQTVNPQFCAIEQPRKSFAVVEYLYLIYSCVKHFNLTTNTFFARYAEQLMQSLLATLNGACNTT
jgi:hypothetical protein